MPTSTEAHTLPPATAADEWLTTHELAAMLKLSLTAIERLKATGALPAHVALSRRTHRWRRADVLAWLAEKQEESRRGQERRRS